jgi:DHA2 family multidrug resistance protein-like MFS transporter
MSSIGSSQSRWWALAAVNLAVIAVGLDGTVLSVALPTLAHALHASESDLQWFSSGYLLVLAAAMLPVGLLGDRFGRKRVMLPSLALFAVGSAACAYSTSPGAFIAARALLALAGAGVIVMALSALTVLFSEEERPKAVGVWAAANFLALPIGPILGGWLLSHYWWGWVFILNIPVALLGLAAVALLVPDTRAEEKPGLDLGGVALSVAGLVALTYGLIDAGKHWTSAGALVPMLAGLAILAAFGLWEHRLAHSPGGRPLLDPELIRSRSYRWGVILQAVAVLGMVGVLFTMPQFFQAVLGTDAMGSGLRLLPLIVGLILGAVPADQISRRVGAKTVTTAGFLLLMAGLLLGSRMSVNSTDTFIAVWMALVGVGMGLSMATAASAALAELPQERGGIGSAVMQALNKTGAPLGAAILGSALTAAYLARLHLGGLPAALAGTVRHSVFGGTAVAAQLHSQPLLANVRDAFTHGIDEALLISAGIALAGALLSLLFLPNTRAAAKAERASSAKEQLVVEPH